MFYTIYKTTNLINGKYYIGKHQTKNLDDGYYGSGKRLKYAIQKYGKENFITDILFVYDEEWKMNLAEKILVVPDTETNYNLCSGGQGGFGYINKNRDHKQHNKKLAKNRDYSKTNFKYSIERIESLKKMHADGVFDYEKTKKNLNPYANIGKIWINNKIKEIKIPKDNLDEWISKGYQKGRLVRF